MKPKNVNRRDFLTRSAVAGLGIMGLNAVWSSCSRKVPEGLGLPPMLDKAPDGKKLRAGLIGCGARGTGAAIDFIDAGNDLEISALGDVFQDQIDECRKKLKEAADVDVPGDKCFTGFDAYKKVIDSGVDIVLLATPPHFRPEHFAAAVDARKHVFLEKPLAVDPVGARSVIATARQAEGMGLVTVVGTQRRHSRDYIENFKRVKSGAIGEIVSARCYGLGGPMWYRKRRPGWSDMEYMLRDWGNWTWLSGDFITEFNIHSLDVINWFAGGHPVKANGIGSRQRRVSGNQYDQFGIDYTYQNGMHLNLMCYQISGCSKNVSEFVQGTEGASNCVNRITDLSGETVWEYQYQEELKPWEITYALPALKQEHVDLVTCIRQGIPRGEAEDNAVSTLTAIMGRIAAYTGREVTWEEMMTSDLRLGPSIYAMGPSDLIHAPIPVPGTEQTKGIR